MKNVDLTRPCDACGKMIGGSFKHCPNCNIYLCNVCWFNLMYMQKNAVLVCPMCGEKLIFP